MFFSMYDLKNRNWMFEQKLLVVNKNIEKGDNFILSYFNVKIVKFKGNSEQLLFSCRSSKKEYFSTLYLFDFKSQKIIKEYSNGSIFTAFKLCDLNNDSYPEILLTSSAFGQDKLQNEYPDNTNWLFVLDTNFQNFWKPINFGVNKSEIKIYPFKTGAEN